MSTPTAVVVRECNYWIRVNLAAENHLRDALLNILHNRDNDPSYVGLPEDEVLFYHRMVKFKLREQNNLKNVIKLDQWNILCPPTGKTQSKKLDITLIVIVIRYETKLTPPCGGWILKLPHRIDVSKAAFCLLARELRNKIKHGTVEDISTLIQFDEFWAKFEFILIGLCYSDMTSFYKLKTNSLDPHVQQITDLFVNKVNVLEKDMKELKEAAGNTEEIANISKSISNLEHHKDAWISSMGELQEDVTVLKENMTELKEEIKEDVTVLKENMTELKEEIKDMKKYQYGAAGKLILSA